MQYQIADDIYQIANSPDKEHRDAQNAQITNKNKINNAYNY